MPNIINVLASGVLSARAAASAANQGWYYFATDVSGGTLYQSTGTSWVQLAPGVTATGAIVAPAVRAFNSGNISVPNAAITALTLDSTRFDLNTSTAQHSTSSNTSRLVCRVAGVYQITGVSRFASNTAGNNRLTLLLINGTTEIARASIPTLNAAQNASVTALWNMALSDYVELCVYQDSGGALNVEAIAAMSPELMMVQVG